jgi:Uma2 family endonuclease
MHRMGTRPVTAIELQRMPGDPRTSELVRGRVQTMSPPGQEHGDIGQRLSRAIDSWVHAHNLGRYYASEVGFWIERDPDTVRAPDGAFVRAGRLRGRGRNRGYIEGAPDLAIEILSPNDSRRQANEKCRMWIAAGAATAVLIDPDRQAVTVFTADGESKLGADASLTLGELIPGLAIPLHDLFADD